jgi:SAM-dependent methyltransferase
MHQTMRTALATALGVALVAHPSARAPDATRLAEALGLRAGMVVADVGAGAGEWTVALAPLLQPGGRVFATEINAGHLATIRRAVEDAGLANVTLVEARADDTGLPDACCDAAFLRYVYHHLTDPHATLASLVRALKPGGQLAVIDFEASSGGAPAGVPDDRGGHGMPVALLEEELRRAGFVAVHTTHGWSGRDYLVVARRASR